MLYNGKEMTSQEVLAILEKRDQELAEAKDELKKLSEGEGSDDTASDGAAEGASEGAAEGASEEVGSDSADSGEKSEGGPTDGGAAEGSESSEATPEGDSQGTDDKGGEQKEMSEKTKKLAEENRKLSERIVSLEETNRKASVDVVLNAYADKGVPPAILEVAKAKMLADEGKLKTFKFNEDGKTVAKSLSDCVIDMLDAIQGIEFAEMGDREPNGDVNVNPASERDELIRKTMSENEGMDYNTAYHKLLDEGKVEAIKVLRD